MWSKAGQDMVALYTAKPWRVVTRDDMGAAAEVPTMLSMIEQQLYHWVGANAAGLGATLDLGAFAGGSASRLLSGLALSGHPYHLHAYDRFTADPSVQQRFLKSVITPTNASMDILPLAEKHLAPWEGECHLLAGRYHAKALGRRTD